MECARDLKTLRGEVQLDRVYACLAGLDDIFDKVRSDILRTQPLPFVEEVFSIVRREAQRHATLMGSSVVGNQGGTLPVAMELKKKLLVKERASSGASGRCPPMVAATTGNKDAVPT
ncbi:unnamed protein product [Prunus armeniaca]